MAINNAVVISSETANDIKNRALTYHNQNVPAKVEGNFYFAKTDDAIGLSAGPFAVLHNFVANDGDVAEHQMYSQEGYAEDMVIYDVRDGYRYVYDGASATGYTKDTARTIWSDFGIGRMLYNPRMRSTHFVISVGNVILLTRP